MLSYRYQPLQCDDSIRLLALQPSLNYSDPIICTLRRTRISSASLEYEALSYTWGDNTQQQTINLHNRRRTLLVGENCCNALRRLRLESKERLLWVDAICINQNDLAERACQVRIMDRIFSCASHIMVYLGEHSAGSPILFEELAAADVLLERTDDCDRPCPSREVVQELDTLYQRPWFRRVWVLQEVCSKDSVTIMCGSASASFNALKSLHFGYSRRTRVAKNILPLALELIHRPPIECSTPQFTLWNRLYKSRICLATDPKDKVFALKSLVGSAHSEMDHLINYTQTLEQCFIEVATFLLPVLGLLILAAVRHPHKRDLPSWIPDWSQDLPLCYLWFMEPAPEFVACESQKHKRCSFSVEKNGNRLELLVRGCEYARIDETSPLFRFHDADDALEQMKGLFSCFGCLEEFLHLESVQSDGNMADQFGQRIFDALSVMTGSEVYRFLGRGLFGRGPDLTYYHSNENARTFIDSLHECRISLMENKELAIVPASAKIGDMVCILSGTISPCVLRSDHHENWTLISGDCYTFAESFREQEYGWFLCDDYILSHSERVQDFRIR